MKILIVTPAPPGSRKGNRVTAIRWAQILRKLGHSVTIAENFARQRCDLLVALHARRSAPSVAQFTNVSSGTPVILALTGTDLYSDIHTDPTAQLSLEQADRLIVLQPLGTAQLPEKFHDRVHVIYQSIRPPPGRFVPRKAVFDISVVGHMREVKDPFRAAEASHLLPTASSICVRHTGGALSADMADRAEKEQAKNTRYRWLGELPRWQAIREIARSRLHVLTSQMEGGAHVICEAIACNVPVVSSHISGSVGLLGADYPGYFPVGDTQALADLMLRCEQDPNFYRQLKKLCGKRATLVHPDREQRCWKKLLDELFR